MDSIPEILESPSDFSGIKSEMITNTFFKHSQLLYYH